MSVASRLSRRFAERTRFGSTASWLWTLYSSAANGRSLPGRGALRCVRLAGHPRPFFIRLGTTDYSVLQEIFLEGEYAALSQLDLGPVATIVDLGANVGFSVRLWQQLFPAAAIVAVEPDAANIAVCEKNVLAEPAPAARPAPVLIQACAAGHSRRVDLDRSTGAWGYSMREHAAAAPAPGELEALTIDEILQRAGLSGPIDLLKCDIEGAEEELFGEGGPWLDSVRTMVVELHGRYTPDRFLSDIGRSGQSFSTSTVVKGPANWVVTAQRVGSASSVPQNGTPGLLSTRAAGTA